MCSCSSWLEAGAVFLGGGGRRVAEEGENLGREAGDLVIADGRVGGEGVADAERVVAHEPDDVAGPGLVHGLALAAEELVRGRKPRAAARLHVGHDHVAFEPPRAHPEEGDAVAVLRVHVGLNLENEARRTSRA